MHNHSVASFKQLDHQARRDAVLNLYTVARPMTDRQVAEGLGFQDMNAVRPTITHLIQSSALRECGVTTCSRTGRQVRLCRRATPAERAAGPPRSDHRIGIGPKAFALLTKLSTRDGTSVRNTIYDALRALDASR